MHALPTTRVGVVLTLTAATALSAALTATPARAAPGTTLAAEGNGASLLPSITPDGRFVAFSSAASNLVPGDTNNAGDIFVRDRWRNTTQRVDVSGTGAQANDWAWGAPLISANGRWVAFSSSASNLVPGDTNRAEDLFVRDRWAGTTTRVNVGPTGAQASSGVLAYAATPDMRFVVFTTGAAGLVADDTDEVVDVFVRDRWRNTTQRISVGPDGQAADDSSWGNPWISADGRLIAFSSRATNLVPNDANGTDDLFVRDRWNATTERVSVSSTGVEGDGSSGSVSMSPDGRFLAYVSEASNLVAGDDNGYADVFVRDRAARRTTRVNVGGAGEQADSFTYNVPSLTPDGRVVLFTSMASNLAPPDGSGLREDVFLRDRWSATTVRAAGRDAPRTTDVSATNTGLQALSSDGRYVAFSSNVPTLVPGDDNAVADIFVGNRWTGTVERISLSDGTTS